jgi:hypothetical protein
LLLHVHHDIRDLHTNVSTSREFDWASMDIGRKQVFISYYFVAYLWTMLLIWWTKLTVNYVVNFYVH